MATSTFLLYFPLLLLLLLLTLSTTATTTATALNPSPPLFTLARLASPPPPPPPHLQEPPQPLQLNTIIDAIIGAGDFTNFANMITEADPSLFPITATIFIPDDIAFPPPSPPPSTTTTTTVNSADALLFTYHIIPRRLSFSQLRRFPIGSHLPTLFPNNTLLITNNSDVNFTINNVALTHPDLFQNAVVSVHGIGSVLDYTLFGETVSSPETSPENSPENSPEKMESSSVVIEVSKNGVKSQVISIFLIGFWFLVYLEIVGVDFDIVYGNCVSRCCNETTKRYLQLLKCVPPPMLKVDMDFGLYIFLSIFPLLILGLFLF